ncbi:MAG: hypothetical protein A4E31_00705 [Methanomassiliicoccales archaeon PtaU1.Bin030]|nr:MAG: hypothetical protein A4E31_00705 [Methanomassiliicoccales archaeon PtaU1.Bin030]
MTIWVGTRRGDTISMDEPCPDEARRMVSHSTDEPFKYPGSDFFRDNVR